MIASSAAIFAFMASLTAGQAIGLPNPNPAPGNALTILPNPSTRDQAIAACNKVGLQLAAITGANIQAASNLLPGNAFGWVASWEGNNYGGSCLQLQAGTITVAGSCSDLHLPVCQGAAPHPQPPCPSSSSSDSYIPCSSSSSSDSSCPVFSSSSDCGSSSSFNCISSSMSDGCSSSSSSSGRCDPCCAGVQKLTYQAKFAAGAYLAKVSQKFSVFDVFGTNACQNVGSLANNLGVNAVLVGSDGLNSCVAQIDTAEDEIDTANTNVGTANSTLGTDLNAVSFNLATVQADITALNNAIESLITKVKALSALPIDYTVQLAINNLNSKIADLVTAMATFTNAANATPPPTQAVLQNLYGTSSTGLNIAAKVTAVSSAITTAVTGLDAVVAAANDLPYGTYYPVSRAWALNQPIYSLLGGLVSAANSLYNCYGEYRAIYVTKPLAELTYVNGNGNACLQQCQGQQSCLNLCGGLKPPGYKLPFRF